MAEPRGRSKGLSRERIRAAAIDLVDREGIEALTMRELGRACGVRAMSLYRYVASKDDLLDAVQEGIVAQMRPLEADLPWREAVEATAREFRRVLSLHPRAITLFVRPATTEGALTELEQVWRELAQAGFGDNDALRAVRSLLAFVVGQAMWQFAPEGDRGGADEFEFGLELMLRGLEAKLGESSAPAS